MSLSRGLKSRPRREEQELAVVAERRRGSRVPSVRDRELPSARERVEPHLARARSSSGRDHAIHSLSGDQAYWRISKRRGRVDEGDRLCVDRHEAQALEPVRPEELPAVRRPNGLVVVGVRPAGDLHRVAAAVLGTDVQLVLPGLVGDRRRSICRRATTTASRSWTPDLAAQVAGGAVLCGNGERVAARGDDDPLAVGRRGDGLDEFRHVYERVARRRRSRPSPTIGTRRAVPAAMSNDQM